MGFRGFVSASFVCPALLFTFSAVRSWRKPPQAKIKNHNSTDDALMP